MLYLFNQFISFCYIKTIFWPTSFHVMTFSYILRVIIFMHEKENLERSKDNKLVKKERKEQHLTDSCLQTAAEHRED